MCYCAQCLEALEQEKKKPNPKDSYCVTKEERADSLRLEKHFEAKKPKKADKNSDIKFTKSFNK